MVAVPPKSYWDGNVRSQLTSVPHLLSDSFHLQARSGSSSVLAVFDLEVPGLIKGHRLGWGVERVPRCEGFQVPCLEKEWPLEGEGGGGMWPARWAPNLDLVFLTSVAVGSTDLPRPPSEHEQHPRCSGSRSWGNRSTLWR